MQGAEKLFNRHTVKAKDSISLKTTEDRDRQSLIEKITYGVEFSNPYAKSVGKKTEIIDTAEKKL